MPRTPAPGACRPSMGLRFFVDALLEFGDLGREERARIDNQVRAAAEGGGFEGALAETTQPAFRPDARRRRRADDQDRSAAETCRIRAARARPGARHSRRRRRLGREPGDRHPGRHAGLGPRSRRATISMRACAGRTLTEAQAEIEAARSAARAGTRRYRRPPGRRGPRLLGGTRRERASN